MEDGLQQLLAVNNDIESKISKLHDRQQQSSSSSTSSSQSTAASTVPAPQPGQSKGKGKGNKKDNEDILRSNARK